MKTIDARSGCSVANAVRAAARVSRCSRSASSRCPAAFEQDREILEAHHRGRLIGDAKLPVEGHSGSVDLLGLVEALGASSAAADAVAIASATSGCSRPRTCCCRASASRASFSASSAWPRSSWSCASRARLSASAGALFGQRAAQAQRLVEQRLRGLEQPQLGVDLADRAEERGRHVGLIRERLGDLPRAAVEDLARRHRGALPLGGIVDREQVDQQPGDLLGLLPLALRLIALATHPDVLHQGRGGERAQQQHDHRRRRNARPGSVGAASAS